MYGKVIDALNARRFQCTFVETAEKAKKAALALIGDRSVGMGGSKTVSDLGIYEALLDNGNEVFWHWKVPKEEKAETRKKALNAGVFLCSSNAILEDGRLVNIDGTGNRIAGMFFGPPTVLVIAGVNKIAKDYDSAITRIKQVACGPNARRQGFDTPCARLNECHDCKTLARMCNVTTIQEYPTRVGADFHVILVNQTLGL